MDLLFDVLVFLVFLFLLVSLFFGSLMLRMFTGKSIGNPEYAPVQGTVYQQAFYLSRLYDYLTEIARTKPTFRLLTPEKSVIYTTDPRNIEHILKTQFDKYSKGQDNKFTLTDLLGTGIFNVDGEKWKQQRKLASYEFSTRVLRDFSCQVFRKNASKLVRVISKLSDAGMAFDFQDNIMRCTLDSIFKVGFGVELNCLEASDKASTDFMKAFDDSNALIYWRYVDPLWKLKRLLNIGCEATLKRNIKLVNDFVHGVIKKKRKQLEMKVDPNEKEDILSRFLSESKKDPENLNDQYLKDIILNFLVAGKDTSANTLSWLFYMLCKNPLVQEKIAQEIEDVTGIQDSEVCIDDFVAQINDAILEQMHYLHAALSETLRLYPAVPLDGRCTEADDVLPDGYRLNKGDEVQYMAYSMGRMPHIWGDDAEEFRPERWLKNGIYQPESPFKFISFHAGPRICLGKDFAYRQMKIVVMALLRCFRFKLADETRKVTYRTMLTLHIDGSLPLLAFPRLTNHHVNV